MVKTNEAVPLQAQSNCCPCPPSPPAPITPIVSVRSVNGSVGDVVLKTLKFGNKEYNGSDDKVINASDLGLEKSFVYVKSIQTVAKVIEEIESAPVGRVYFCNENKSFYLSVGEGDYKVFPSLEKLDEYAKKNETAYKVELEIASSTSKIKAVTYDRNGTVIAESAEKQLPVGNLTQQITAGVAIGNITVGEVLPAGTSLESIIRRMLTAPPAPTTVEVYVGGLTNLPTSDADISSLTKSDVPVTSLTTGVAKNIPADEKYVVIAYKKSIGNISSITEDGFEAISDFSNIVTGSEYKFYCTSDKVYDPDAEINYVVKWSVSNGY